MLGKNVKDDITHCKKLDGTCFVAQKLLCNMFLVTSHAQSKHYKIVSILYKHLLGKRFFIFYFPFKLSRQLLDGDVGPWLFGLLGAFGARRTSSTRPSTHPGGLKPFLTLLHHNEMKNIFVKYFTCQLAESLFQLIDLII